MNFTEDDKLKLFDILKERNIDDAFKIMTETNWWANNLVTNDTERENFLYETYFNYHYLIFTEGVKGIDTLPIGQIVERIKLTSNTDILDSYMIMNKLKIQLDKELNKVRSGKYTDE